MLVIVLETSENLYIFCDILLKNSEKVNNMINELKSPATSFFIKVIQLFFVPIVMNYVESSRSIENVCFDNSQILTEESQIIIPSHSQVFENRTDVLLVGGGQ